MYNPNQGDDIRDLAARYATGSLTEEEQKRLFDAALDDQDLFDQLVADHDVKQLLAEPGARDRMLHALKPPQNKSMQFLAFAATFGLAVLLVVFLVRPKPPQQTQQKQQVAVATTAPVPAPAPEPAPIPAPVENTPAPIPPTPQQAYKSPVLVALDDKAKADKEMAANEVSKPEAPKALKKDAAPLATTMPTSAPVAPAQQVSAADQAATGGPRQAVQLRASAPAAARPSQPSFGFHYSTETKGHLILVPLDDGYLGVKSGDTVLYALQSLASGSTTDVAIPAGATTVTVTFARTNAPVAKATTTHSELEATVQGTSPLVVDIKVHP